MYECLQLIKGEVHPKPGLSMFWALSQNYRHCFEKLYKHPEAICLINQGSLKGESVVAAIVSSRIEQSYCTSGFFRFQARFLTSSAPILTITHYLRMCFFPTRNLIRTSRGNINVPKRRTFSKIKKFKISSKLWWLQLHIWYQIKGPIIFHLKVHTVKLKCVDYKIFSKKHDLPFLKLENIHNFDTYLHPLRNIVLKLFDDNIM